MGSIVEKINYAIESKSLIKDSIEEKGVEVGNATLREYYEKILEITGGGGGSTVSNLGSLIITDDSTGLKCLGTIYNIEDYPKLAEYIEYIFGSVNHFGGDGVDTFAVPNFGADSDGTVPALRNNTNVISSAQYSSSYAAWCAFSQTTSNEMSLTTPIGGYIGYNFGKPVLLNCYKIRARSNQGSMYMIPTAWDLQGRNSDDESWNTIEHRTGISWTTALEEKYFVLKKGVKYQQYRIISTLDSTNTNYFGINELQFFAMYSMFSQENESSISIYDLDYVQDDTLLFWVDAISNTHRSDDTHTNTSGYWQLKEGECVMGNLGQYATWGNDCINFNKTHDSYARFNTYLTQQFLSKFTVECFCSWSSPSDSGNNECFSSRESGGWLIGNYSGKIYFGAVINGSSFDLFNTENTVANQKYYISVTYDGEYVKLYIDGVLKNTISKTGNMTNPNTCVWIGTDGMGTSPESGSSYNMAGKVYSARIYNRALSSEEINQNYNVDYNRFVNGARVLSDIDIRLDKILGGDS